MSGLLSRTCRPIRIIPSNTRCAGSSAPFGDIKMWEVATALTMLPMAALLHQCRQEIAHGDVLGDLRLHGHLVVHAQRRMDADAIERAERAVAQRGAFRWRQACSSEHRVRTRAQTLQQLGLLEQAREQRIHGRCGWSVHVFTCACRKVLVAAMKSAGASSLAQWPQWGMK